MAIRLREFRVIIKAKNIRKNIKYEMLVKIQMLQMNIMVYLKKVKWNGYDFDIRCGC